MVERSETFDFDNEGRCSGANLLMLLLHVELVIALRLPEGLKLLLAAGLMVLSRLRTFFVLASTLNCDMGGEAYLKDSIYIVLLTVLSL